MPLGKITFIVYISLLLLLNCYSCCCRFFFNLAVKKCWHGIDIRTYHCMRFLSSSFKEILDLSHNNFTHFSCNMEMVWNSSLKRLYLSSNHLATISWNVCQLSGLQDLDLSHNNIRLLPKPEFWTCSTLHKLNLSSNKVTRRK